MTDLPLLSADGVLTRVALREAPGFVRPEAPLRTRIAYAAAHVVPKAHADNTPGRPADIDWDATLAFRRHVYGWGLGVADAMDTAQRNMGLDAAATRELIARSAEVAREAGGSVVVGVNTDHVDEEHIALDRVIDAYRAQLEFTEEQGAGPVLMASRHLARAAQSAADYRRVYREVLRAATAPVVLHWLGTAFDPALEGYFGSADWRVAADVLLEIIAENPGAVAGVKMSLLDAESEVSVRARLPEGVRMFTGDDFNYVGLIGGDEGAGVSSRSARSTTGEVPDLDEGAGVSSRSARSTTGAVPDLDEVAGVSSRSARSTTGGAPDLDEVAGVSSRSARSTTGEVPAPVEGHSDALLGAFAAITPVASAAIQALDAGDPAGYLRILGPTEALSRQVFAAPTFYYKTGVAFLSWLNGHQAAFQMVGGLHSARSLPHLSRIVELANASQALERPDLAASRWSDLLRLNGVAP
ncbi:dihydrodipicolinate synthase family protein [Microbacterium sp. PA5]|uniref:dihydrodipicolinate synthase family protein n=1 Tax=Microbacterium sp. PA5 TaxID=3416654 RepID=UPI003CF6882A